MILEFTKGPKSELILTSHDKFHEYAYEKIFEKLGIACDIERWDRTFIENDEVTDIRKYAQFTANVNKAEQEAIRKLVRLYELPMSDVHYDLTRRVYA